MIFAFILVTLYNNTNNNMTDQIVWKPLNNNYEVWSKHILLSLLKWKNYLNTLTILLNYEVSNKRLKKCAPQKTNT